MGYLYLDGFDLHEYQNVDKRIQELRKAGIRRLVLDLRYNGGGLTANELDLDARLLGGRFEGFRAVRKTYNRKYRDNNGENAFPAVQAGRLELIHLVVLTGEHTCSASEALINNLKPYLRVQTVGATTCGKPMIMDPIAVGDTLTGVALQLVTATMANSKGVGGYFKGIPPDCPAADDGLYDLGDPRESLLKEALHLLKTGKCSQYLHLSGARSWASRDGAAL